MRQQHDLLQLEKPGMYGRFVFVDVQTGSGDSTILKGYDQGRFVYHRTPRGVEKDR